MKKTVVIHQPDFLPYLGFFHRFLEADCFVVLDNVQYLRKGWHNRDKIKTPQGEKWITVAVRKTVRDRNINEIFLSKEQDWRKKNLNLIHENYKTSQFFSEVIPFVEELYSYQCEKLLEFNLKSIHMLMDCFDIKIESILASSLNPLGHSNELLVNILKKVEATTYLSGIGAKCYFDPEPYRRANIEVIWQSFKYPVYPQLYGEFIPNLSSMDLLFNCGIEESRKILRRC